MRMFEERRGFSVSERFSVGISDGRLEDSELKIMFGPV